MQLPEAVKQMLDVVAETAWRPADLNRLSSIYPNHAMAGGGRAKVADVQMVDILRKWEALSTQDEAFGQLGRDVEVLN